MAEKKRIIITGISSELMQSFVVLIDLNLYEIIGLSRYPEKIHLPGTQIIQGDLNNTEALEPYLKGCDMIIHAAAVTHSFNEMIYYDINFEATKKLVELAKQFEVGQFIFISSRAAGEKSGAYGLSKLLAERHIQDNLKDWIVFRPSEIFGGHKEEGIDKLIKDAMHRTFMFCPSNLQSKLYPLHIGDAAELMHRYSFQKGIHNATITINGPEGYSYKNIIQMVRKIAGRRILIIPVPKFVLWFVKQVVKGLSLKIGVVPDQIERLYSEKEHALIDYKFYALPDYIGMLVNSRH